MCIPAWECVIALCICAWMLVLCVALAWSSLLSFVAHGCFGPNKLTWADDKYMMILEDSFGLLYISYIMYTLDSHGMSLLC